MAPNDSAQATEEDREPGALRRKATRYAVPVAVAGVAAATIGLVPALAATGDPDLPKISAQQLIEKMAASDTEQLSGSVKITTDLGLPSLAGLGDMMGGSPALKGGGGGQGDGSAADPAAKLAELGSGSHTLRVAVDGADKQRLSIVDDAAEYSLIHNGDEVWAYDSASNEAYHAKSPGSSETSEGGADREGHKGGHKGGGASHDELPATPQDFAEQALKAVGDTTSVTVDGTSRVAGRDAYQLLIKPKQSGSTVGSVKVAVDSETGTPLKFTLAPSSGGKAVLDVGFTDVDFARPAASTFDFTPPKGTKVTEGEKSGQESGKEPRKAPQGPRGPQGLPLLPGGDHDGQGGMKVIGEGWTAVYVLGEGAGSHEGAQSGKAEKQEKSAKPEGMPADAEKLLGSLGNRVDGKFGSGTVFETRIVNALVTDDGTVYAGAVTKEALLKAANEAK
ncbi:LolA family protein [Streptomyces sp. NPDC004749]